MTRARIYGLLLVLIGGIFFVWLGTFFERTTNVAMVDFKAVYIAARCILEHHDPYNPERMEHIYVSEAAGHSSDSIATKRVVIVYIYLPSAFILTVPFALLTWGPAHVVWMVVTAASYILAALLMWHVGASRAPVVSGWLICFFLITSELLIEVGNAAGVAVSLCVIAVWCFLQERFVPVGVLCFAVSLLVKPNDAGLIWLYFLLAGGTNRKHALRTLLVAAILALPAILCVSYVAPHWFQELHSNLVVHSARGFDSDPGPVGIVPWGHAAQLVNLQTALSVFQDNPRFYNPVAYCLCGALLTVWSIVVIRSRFTLANAWLALAFASSISMLPVYHRQHDTRLLLLTFPAFALLWKERGPIRWLALAVTTAGVGLTGDSSMQLLGILAHKLGSSTSTFSGRLLLLVLGRPAPLVLLAMSLFYLWAFLRYDHLAKPDSSVRL
jgi:hypothetical protein